MKEESRKEVRGLEIVLTKLSSTCACESNSALSQMIVTPAPSVCEYVCARMHAEITEL